jgi:MFS family permease
MKLKNIPRQVILLGFISLFTDMASEMLYPVTPIFLSGILGASMAIIGLIEGLAELTAGLMKGYFGFLSDKLGKRAIFVILGYSISALSKPLPGLIPQTAIVFLSRIADRTGKGIRTAPRDALLAGYSDKNNKGAIFGFHRGMDTLGAVIGPLIGLLLLSIYSFNYRIVFLYALIPSLAAIAVTLFIKDKKREIVQIIKPVEDSQKKWRIPGFSFWKESPKDYKMLTLVFTIFSFVNSSDVFLILRSKDISHSTTTAILLYVFYNLIYAIVSYPAGIFSDRFGKRNALIIGLVIFSGVYFGFGLSSGTEIIWILFLFYGIYAAFSEGVVKAWVSDLVTDKKRGSAIGLLTMLSGFAIMLGSLVTGILWDAFGASVPFIISGIISLISAFLLYFLNRRELRNLTSD